MELARRRCDGLNQWRSVYAEAPRRRKAEPNRSRPKWRSRLLRTRLVSEASELTEGEAYRSAADLTSIYLPGRSSSPQLHEMRFFECRKRWNWIRWEKRGMRLLTETQRAFFFSLPCQCSYESLVDFFFFSKQEYLYGHLQLCSKTPPNSILH